MFLRFTKKFSRPVHGFIIALLMLFAPALIATTVESAPQKNKAKATPTPKKKAAPDKKTQAKTKPTPKPDSKSKSKTASKNTKETASKNKSADRRNDKRNEKINSAKNDRKQSDRSKNARTADKKNSKQKLAANNKIPSKTSKNDRLAKSDRNAKNNDRNKSAALKKSSADKNKARLTPVKNTRTTVAKTTPKKTPKRTVETKATTENTTKNTVTPTIEANPDNSSTTTENSQIIVATFSAPVRSQASASAPVLSNVKLGTVLRVAEKKSDWYKVQYLTGGQTATGWISAASVNSLNASGRTEIYRQIAERNYKPQMDFESAAEFYEFTSKAGGDSDGSEKSAEIELKRLLALRSALKTIPADRREIAPYKDFLKAQEKEIVFNEPAGEWLVVSNEFWNLHSKYKKLTVSDTIAWEAANNPLPGECEGYVNCYLFDMRMRFGEYLNLHPNGSRAAEALKNMTDYLSPIVSDASQKTVYNGPTDVTDRAEFNSLLAELRTIIARLPFVEKEKTLQQLRTIGEAYR